MNKGSLNGSSPIVIREFYEIIKIRTNSFYRITSNFQMFRIRIAPAVDYTEATVEWEQWAVVDSDSDTGKGCRRFVDFVIGCVWSCRTADELTNIEQLTSQNF